MSAMPEPPNVLPQRSMPKEELKAYLKSLEAYAVEQIEQGRSEKEIAAELRDAGHLTITKVIVRQALHEYRRRRLGVSKRQYRFATGLGIVVAVIALDWMIHEKTWLHWLAIIALLLGQCWIPKNL